MKKRSLITNIKKSDQVQCTCCFRINYKQGVFQTNKYSAGPFYSINHPYGAITLCTPCAKKIVKGLSKKLNKE